MNGRNRPPEWPIRRDQETTEEPRTERETEIVRDRGSGRGGLSWTTIALIGGLIVLVLLVAYLATSRNPDQDKLIGNEAAENAVAPADPAKLCTSKATYDLIKRDLFHRAAQVRGSDEAAFNNLSGYAVLRVENPVMESQDNSTGAVNCSASLALDLPPGVAVVDGRRTLSSDVDYTVQPAADGSGNVVALRSADAIVTPLATLTRVAQQEGQPAGGEPGETPTTEAPDAGQTQPDVSASESANKEVGPKTSSSARPSFDCSNASTKGEIAVCSDSGLAALDVNMATQYRRALASASPEEKAMLQRTRDRFLSYRDRCPNRSCIADAYVGRMREIRDIMEGSWRPPR
ncbi:MAG TPA: hypothetical protein VFK28_12645 [Sphingomicrobium sp.]|nr:hypothetical protein [Sphingomicrobium sp.]